MKKLLQINPVLRVSTSTGRIMQEIGELAMRSGWESYVAYGKGRDGLMPCKSQTLPVGGRLSTLCHGVQTRLADRHGLASQAATRRLIRQIDTLRPDIIHLHNLHGYYLNYPSLFRYLSRCGIPVVWTIHDCWAYTGHCYYYSFVGCTRWETGCHRCPQQRSFPASWFRDRSRLNYLDKKSAFTSLPVRSTVVVPVSEWICGELSRSFLSGYTMRVIHNGIDTGVFHPCASSEVLSKYGLSGKRVYLGVASIWSKEKGLDDLLRLSRLLSDSEVLVLVGVDAAQLRRLPARVVGIRRTADVKELACLYSAASVFLNPTWQDNYPTVNLEAISCGTPVATYRTGGSVEAVTEGTGLVVEQGDVPGLLSAARALSARGQAHNAQLCRAYALRHFRKEDRYSDYISLYNELLSETSSY